MLLRVLYNAWNSSVVSNVAVIRAVMLSFVFSLGESFENSTGSDFLSAQANSASC